MKNFTNFALKDQYKHLQSVGDKFAETDYLIDWTYISITFESIYLDKKVSWGITEADVIIMFKLIYLQQCHGLSDFELENQCIEIEFFFFRKFRGFP